MSLSTSGHAPPLGPAIRPALREGEPATAPSHQASASVILIVADGVRPDTLASALDAGTLPALARLRAEGALRTVTSVCPSVTGPAYTPFLLGRYPGPIGLPGLRWFDRARTAARRFGNCRSYVGVGMRHVDTDLDPDAPTLFELARPAVGALSVIRRGLPPSGRVGSGASFAARAARTHFAGNLAGWLEIDRHIAREVARRVREQRPRVVFCALTGVDKASHAGGHTSAAVSEALRIVDDAVAELRHDAERDGRWESTHLWVVSDHGHSPVGEHDDLATVLRAFGHRTAAHPWAFAGGRDAAVMVSGNAMAHIYLELERTRRPWWPELRGRWGALVDALLERPSVDLVVLPLSPDEFEVVRRGRGAARLLVDGTRYSYHPASGDPLGLGEQVALSDQAALDVTLASEYPDALVQITRLAGSPRSGELILSATRGWDFRGRYEPIPHVSSHGALHRDHMMVPLLLNRPPAGVPRRTVDVMPSALAALGLPIPQGLDGISFV